MGEIWSDFNKFRKWFDVELAILKAKEELRIVPFGTAEKVRESAGISINRIEELEKTTGHDVMAFVQSISEQLIKKGLAEQAQHFHAGMTSYDILDTALAVSMRDSIKLLRTGLNELLVVLGANCLAHRDTIQIGRTHGIHAEPITFGFKMVNWYDELERHEERLGILRERISVGKISGAVGTYANIDPAIEDLACEMLALKPARISTQIISRDRHAEYVFTLALIAGSLAKFAIEIRNLQRTEIDEVSEPFKKGQKGSSAMPHKQNPIASENISSLTRLMRGFVQVALENQETWHERDIANSANERIILADSSILLDYMLARLTNILRNWTVKTSKMEDNLWLSQGRIFSEQVMLALAQKGMPREEAHDLVQELALLSAKINSPFKDLLWEDPRIKKLLTQEELEGCFKPEDQLKNIKKIYDRFIFRIGGP